MVLLPAGLVRLPPPRARQCPRTPKPVSASTVDLTSIALHPRRSTLVETRTSPASSLSRSFPKPGRSERRHRAREGLSDRSGRLNGKAGRGNLLNLVIGSLVCSGDTAVSEDTGHAEAAVRKGSPYRQACPNVGQPTLWTGSLQVSQPGDFGHSQVFPAMVQQGQFSV